MPSQVGDVVVKHIATLNPDKDPSYLGSTRTTTVLRKGFVKEEGYSSVKDDVIHDANIEIPMRDGVKLRADVFRPTYTEPGSNGNATKVPLLLVWSPYGKTASGSFKIDMFAGRVGVSKSATSGFESFEGPDPVEWVRRGYAVCNINARGAFDSEGDIRWWGSAEGRDGYDAIEHFATLPWCSGRIAMAGNSWLAIAQWFIASENPPHLTCIAPLEGASDIYREMFGRGGVPALPFAQALAHLLYGRNQQEDIASMVLEHPTWNEYWQDKRVDFSRITIPTYILASYSSFIHTEGSFRGYEEIAGPKWLRVHPYQEWYDLYNPETVEDLQKFFDRYLKNIDNGWETSTPRVRLSILQYNKPPIINHVFEDFPVPSTNYQTLYLNTSGSLSRTKPTVPGQANEGTLSYQSDIPYEQKDADPEELKWSITFDKPTTIVGYSKATLYMSCPDHDDMCVFVQLRKADSSGKLLQNFNIPPEDLGVSVDDDPDKKIPKENVFRYLGPTGILRASHRSLSTSLSKPHKPVPSHLKIEKLDSPAGQIVKLEIAIWPVGVRFEAGEQLVLKVSGHDMRLPEFESLAGKIDAGNKGRHYVYCGGGDGMFSEIVVPFVDIEDEL